MKETIANILKEYTKKNHISASFVILEDYAEELVKHGVQLADDVVPKSEWISVEERLPDTTPKELVILDQDISSGKIENETDAGIAQVSKTVAVLCTRCIDGKVGLTTL